jgi:hypothetical protein
MIFKQFYLACLAHASVPDRLRWEAAVVDPQRDVMFICKKRQHTALRIK